ncbi:MAG: DUF1569 domain-containing protein [Saprospiraceae bacterium]|nr:DUF1569 domain-containing protein [Lewinella sp.]
MALPNIFDQAIAGTFIQRIHSLQPDSEARWGRMNAAQMMAHLNVMFELALENKHERPPVFVRWMMQRLIKRKLTGEAPYTRNSRTAPVMVIRHQPDFAIEQKRLLEYLALILAHGRTYFDLREHPAFGKMTDTEWNNLFYKHIDHHLQQFDR